MIGCWKVYSILLASLCLLRHAESAETVRASLEKESAWTGEPVPLIITLYSPGPFSGTASFDFPELPQTTFISGGSPVVGSETIEGEEYFKQRHEFTVFTQRVGLISLPPFSVRFLGKQTFTSAPEPMSGETKSLQFESKRPPGTESLGVVISARSMKATQAWNPEDHDSIQAGEVIERAIEREATNTTAMMMVPVPDVNLEGVRTYFSDPTVEDRTSRGESTALRKESIKYQFEVPGTHELPSLTFVWWDVGAGELQKETLDGTTVNVTSSTTAIAAQGVSS